MAIKWSDLRNRTRELEIQFQDETVKVRYLVNVVTPGFLRELGGVLEDDRGTLAWQIEQMVESWDVLDDEGQPLKPVGENVDKLPVAFLARVVGAISDDMKSPDDDEKKD